MYTLLLCRLFYSFVFILIVMFVRPFEKSATSPTSKYDLDQYAWYEPDYYALRHYCASMSYAYILITGVVILHL